SSARFTETERRRAPLTPSSLNPFLLLLSLSLLCSFTASAWDDDDADSNPFHRSNYNQQGSAIDYGYKSPYQSKIQHQESRIAPASVIDYGYKNTYQANPSHRTSTIDYGEPKRLSQEDDYTAPKRLVTPQQQYDADRASSIRVPSVQESVALRDRESKELMSESQRRFEKQEADQERSRAQMAKQQEIYDKMDREECEMAEFLGGVYKAKFGATTGRNSAVTTEGYVFRSGNNFVTPRGIYTKTGNTYAGPASFTTQTGTLFFGNNPTTIQAGGAYFSEGESGFIVSPNCRNTSTWRSR
ncbi:MAG: hypothetical protein EBZ78_12250, partial [Verrucomicrobia bacterium]|nr:hypothetical protein [Verrucomicrobiota bacterium]